MRMRCVKILSSFPSTSAGGGPGLPTDEMVPQPGVAKAPRTPGRTLAKKPFYKAIAAGDKIDIAALADPVDGRQRVSAKAVEIFHVEIDPFAGDLAAMADVIVSYDGRKVNQRACIVSL